MSASVSVHPVHDMDFVAEASATGRSITAALSGNADLNVKSELDRFR